MLQVWNTLSDKKEPLPDQKKIRLFVCGPTVYDYAHIGHARTYLFFDFFAKYLRSEGYEVFYLQNITDVDDKIIKRAEEEKKDPAELAKFYTEAYLKDMKVIGADAVSKYAPATEFITQIVAQVKRLIDKEFAYEIKGDGWYFDLAKFPDYGKLSHRNAVQAEDSVSRIDEAIGKKNKGDFCLWKFSKPGEPTWTTELGAGRPGWHIEDTAISEYYFGPQYDIHGGGMDLKFPHHEAEIAQQESASSKTPFVRLWMHTGALLVEGKKMSKSLGNFITIGDFLKKYSPEVLRLVVFSHHYRSPIDYNEKAAEDARINWENIRTFFMRINFAIAQRKKNGEGVVHSEDHTFARPQVIKDALENDVNIPMVLSALFLSISETNKLMWSMDGKTLTKTRNFIKKNLSLLGLVPKAAKIPSKITEMAEKREQSRANKQFEQSDLLRKEINSLGYELEDTPLGPFVYPKH